MKIDRISYQKIFPTGLTYLNHRIGCEISLEEGESADEAFMVAKRFVEEMNLKSNPSYGVAIGQMTEEPPTINLEAEKIEASIDNATSMDGLKKLQSEAIKHNLINRYVEKMKTFKQ